jgi:hypothetical protein
MPGMPDRSRTSVSTAPRRTPCAVSRSTTPCRCPGARPGSRATSTRGACAFVLLHLVAETARHAGHADIVRESIDGATAFPLLAAAEGWPAGP